MTPAISAISIGTATFERVAFIDNSGPFGGALYVPGTNCDATLTNVTLSGNFAPETSGALHNAGGTVTLANVTVTDNLAFGLVGTMTVRNTIVAGNGGLDFPQCSFGPSTSLGHNIDQGDSCGFDQPTDLRDLKLIDLLLGELDETGGSPAIDAIPVEECLDSEDMPLLTDQRGVERPQGSACDIGAVEFVPEPVAMALQLAARVSLCCVAHGRRR